MYRPGTADTWGDPWSMYADLRDHDPVHHVERSGGRDYYVLSRHADVMAAAVDTATYSSAQGLTVEYDELETIGLADNLPLVMMDPPDHTAFRKLVSRGFTPRQVTTVEPAVRAFVVERLDRLRDEGGGDLVEALFKPLPSMVVAHYLGVPDDGRERFDDWTHAIVAASSSGDIAGATQAIGEMMAYFSELIAWRRTEPGDDTISHLVSAGVGDDDRGILSILSYVFAVVTGGNDTTTGMLGGSVQLLESDRDQRRLLIDDQALVGDAVDELLRLTSPVQGLARTTTRDVELHGTTIPAGRRVLLLYGAANRDPRRYGADADELDVRRKPSQILTFGQGSHHCLGASAARLQARVALEELLARCPDFTVDLDAVEWAPGPYVRRPTTVPFRVAG
ncbi:cytochrome P450 [Nocardioides sp. CN2-186]|uniref:cytochrome P450 n=1 Tax=Nocardioides tweenelious TaxID=3156607 RepID=UPI0032B35C82